MTLLYLDFNKEEEESAINRIIGLVKDGKIKESRINRSVKRIINIKKKYKISDDEEIKGVDIENINKQIEEIRKKSM